MHATIRSIVNAATPAEMRRNALNAAQLPSLVLGSGISEVTASTTMIPVPVFSENPAGLAVWQEFTSYQLAVGSLPRCTFFYFMSLRLESTVYLLDTQFWTNLYYRTGGANVYKTLNSKPLWNQTINGFVDARTEDTWTTADAFNIDGTTTIDRVGVRGAINYGGTGVTAASGIVPHGVIGWIAFKR